VSFIIYWNIEKSSTYGHSQLKTGHPVRSAIHKQLNGRLVLRWVTTWESLLLYVLLCFLMQNTVMPSTVRCYSARAAFIFCRTGTYRLFCLENVYRLRISRNAKCRGEKHQYAASQTTKMIHAILRRSVEVSLLIPHSLNNQSIFFVSPKRQMVHGPHPRSDTPHDDNNNANCTGGLMSLQKFPALQFQARWRARCSQDRARYGVNTAGSGGVTPRAKKGDFKYSKGVSVVQEP
jgi:hypothetical protein